MKCTEGFVNCLDKVYEAWTAIVPEGLERYVDTVTVRSLELYAPGACKSDTTSVARVMKDRNRCFPGITNNEDRSEIVNRLLGIKYIIPSLRTFFENQKYLEPCCTILRQLFGESDQKHSLWRAFSANYIKPSELYVQHVEGRLSTVGISADGPTAMGLAYVTLWLFCMRHFPEMTSITPNLPKNADGHDQKQRKRTRFSENACGSHQSNPRKSPVKKRDFNPALWHKLGRLAVDLGLKTKEAEILAAQNPDIEHATRFLKLARPNWAEDRDDPSVQKVRQVLEDMKEEPRPPVTPILSTDDDPNWDDDQRCGKPREDDHEKDKSCLFLWLFAAGSGSGKHITSLYGKRDMLEGFLKPYLPEKVRLTDDSKLHETLTRR
jgi:hypothetical protein